MTNSLKLKALLVELGYTQSSLADKLGVSTYTMNKKINNKVEFKMSEIEKISKILKITNKDDIFFCNNVELNSTNI